MKPVTFFPSLRRAVGEIGLIFLGITLALMFENWSSDRERIEKELGLLTEIYRDLGVTRSDPQRDILSNQRKLDTMKQM